MIKILENAQSTRARETNAMNLALVRFTILIFLLHLILVPANANHVKCKCPNIDARGSGDSSCSASETNGVCSIAFNEFDIELELAAKDSVQKYVHWRKIAHKEFPLTSKTTNGQTFTRENAIDLSNNPDSLIDQILIYSLVSLAEQGITQDQRDHISSAHRSLQKNADAISKIFVSGDSAGEGDGVTVKLGCFEFRTDGFWIMYKASWSKSISNERC